MRYLLIALIVLSASTAFAEKFVCFDETTKHITKTADGDCYSLGICSGFNKTGMDQNCISVDNEEYNTAKQQYKKYDPNIVTGNRFVDWDQAEIDAKVADDQLVTENNLKLQIESLDISNVDLWTAFLQVYNATSPQTQQISKKEILDQIKINKGLTP